ncbi:MAG: tetratricopeptide repeat protein [bacterium]
MHNLYFLCRIITIAAIAVIIWAYSSAGNQVFAFSGESTPVKEQSQNAGKDEPVVDNEVKENFDKAVRLFEMKSYDDSIGWFNKVIRKDHEMTDAYLFRGIAYYQKGLESKTYDKNKSIYEMDQALKNLTVVLEKDPNNANALEYRGLAYYEKDINVKMAVKDFSTLIELLPLQVKSYYYRGRANFQGGYIDEAIADFQTSIEINPDYAESHRELWWIYDLKEKYDEALDFYDRLITAHSQNAKPYYYRGLIYYQKGEYSVALQDFKKALMIDPDYSEALEWKQKARKKILDL